MTALLLAVSLGAWAQQHPNTTYRYRWVDATGLPHYSDSLTVKAVQFGYDVLGPAGNVVRHVPRPMTDAERKASDAQAAQQRDAQRTADDQHRRDEQMLAAYPTEADFKIAQQARLDQLDAHIHTTRINLTSQEQNLAELLDRAADFSRQGQHPPHDLSARITRQRDVVANERSLLKQQQARRGEAEKEVAANLAHYRELTAQLKAQQQGR